MADEDDFVRITLRLPADLHARLNESAAKKRSMNAEIIDRLESSYVQTKATELPRGAIDRLLDSMVASLEKRGPHRYDKMVEALETRAERIEAENDRLRSEIDEIMETLGIKPLRDK